MSCVSLGFPQFAQRLEIATASTALACLVGQVEPEADGPLAVVLRGVAATPQGDPALGHRRLNLPQHRKRTLLLATDPLSDEVIAFALVSVNDQAHRRRFLPMLTRWGFLPSVVNSDGSNLYPAMHGCHTTDARTFANVNLILAEAIHILLITGQCRLRGERPFGCKRS
jgi:hypothetical protein